MQTNFDFAVLDLAARHQTLLILSILPPPLSLTPARRLHRLRGMCKSRRFLMQHGLTGAERIIRPAL